MTISKRVRALDDAARARLSKALEQKGYLQTPKVLTAHVVTDDLPGEEIADRARDILPEYMTPKHIHRWDTFPRLPNGKLDRVALQNTTPDRAASETPDSTDTGASIEALRTIWSEVLGMNPIQDADDFFELGGDSLLSISVVTKARAAGLSLIPSDLFEFPKLEDLAKRVHAIADDASEAEQSGLLVSAKPRTDAGSPIFVINANRRILELLEEQLETPRDLKLITLHWDGLATALTHRIEELALEYTETILREQPSGPYSVGGFSMGAVLAHEVARQLLAQGHAVEDLMLIDPPENPKLFKSTLNPAHAFSGSAEETVTLSRWLAWFPILLAGRLLTQTGIALPETLRPRYIRATYLRAARKYHIPRIAPRPIIVRRATGTETSIWAAPGDIRYLREIDCSHFDFHRTEQSVRSWTGYLAEALRT